MADSASPEITFQDMLLIVAEYYGIASIDSNGIPFIPADDPFNLRECKKIVNDAIRMLIARPPSSGRWHWMNRQETVTFDSTGAGGSNIGSDAARYKLSTNYHGETAGQIHYVGDSNHGIPIQWCDYNEIVQRRELSTRDGYPQYAAIRPYEPTSSTLGATRQWEIIFDPTPSSNQSVIFPYTMRFNNMRLEGGTATGASATTIVDSTRTEPDDYFNNWVVTDISGTGKLGYATVTDYTKSTGTFTVADWLDEEGTAGGTDPVTGSIYVVEPAANLHPMGTQFDDEILAACRARCEMSAEDAELGSDWISYFNDVAMPEAHRKDALSRPRRLGKLTNGRRERYIRIRENVTFNT